MRLWHAFVYTSSVQGPVIREVELKSRVMGCRWKVLNSCLRLFRKLSVFSAEMGGDSLSLPAQQFQQLQRYSLDVLGVFTVLTSQLPVVAVF